MSLRDLPRIIVTEIDQSVFRPTAVEGTRALFIGSAPKGPINTPVLCTDTISLITNFGYPTTAGLFQAYTYLQKTGNPIYYVRTVNSEMESNSRPIAMQGFYPSIGSLGSHTDPSSGIHKPVDLTDLFNLAVGYPHDLPMYMEITSPATNGWTKWRYFNDSTNDTQIWNLWTGYGIYQNSAHPNDYIAARWGSDPLIAKNNHFSDGDAGSTHPLIADIKVDTTHPDAWLYTNSEFRVFLIFNNLYLFSASDKFDRLYDDDFEVDDTITGANFYHASWDITSWEPELLIIATENNDARDEIETILNSIKKGFKIFINSGDASSYKNAVNNLRNKVSQYGMTKYWEIKDNIEARVFLDIRLDASTPVDHSKDALQMSIEVVVKDGATLSIPKDCPISLTLKGDDSNVIFATGLLLSGADTNTISSLENGYYHDDDLAKIYPDRLAIQLLATRYIDNDVWRRASSGHILAFYTGSHTIYDNSWTPNDFFASINSSGSLSHLERLPNPFEIVSLLIPDYSSLDSVRDFRISFIEPGGADRIEWHLNYLGKLLANAYITLNWPTPTYQLLYLDEGMTTKYWGSDVKPMSFEDARIMYINALYNSSIINYFTSEAYADSDLRYLANFVYCEVPGNGFRTEGSLYLQDAFATINDYRQSSIAIYPELDKIFDPYESDILSPAIVDFYMLLIPGVADKQIYQRILTAIDERKDFIYIPELDESLVEDNPKRVNNLIDYALDLPDSSYVATAYPGGYVTNSLTNEATYMPGSILLAVNIGILQYLWLAPSGLARGRVSWLNNLKAVLPQQAADDLYTDAAVIPILMFPGFSNPVIWGNKTFYLRRSDRKSKLQALNVRMLLLYLIRLWRRLLTNFIFDPNDPSVWDRILNVVKPPMDNLKSLGAFSAYRLTNETTNEDRDLGNLRIKVEIDAIRAIERIYVTFVVTRTGALSVAEATG